MVNELVKPASVIALLANEVATVFGKVRPGSKTETFIKASESPVHVPLSGKTMKFGAGGMCTAGCRRGASNPSHTDRLDRDRRFDSRMVLVVDDLEVLVRVVEDRRRLAVDDERGQR